MQINNLLFKINNLQGYFMSEGDLKDDLSDAPADKLHELALKDHFEGVVLKKSPFGKIIIDISQLSEVDLTIITNGAVRLRPPPINVNLIELGLVPGSDDVTSSSRVDSRAYKIGDVLPDGWVVGPVSPKTRKVMSIEPVREAVVGTQVHYKGVSQAVALLEEGHLNARLPSMSELRIIYKKIVKAELDHNSQLGLVQYWSSEKDEYDSLLAFDFKKAKEIWKSDQAFAHIRCVRDEPGITL
jgi:hypothetical protein